MKHFDTIFRIFFAVFMIAGYVLMAFFKDLFMPQTAYWKKLLVASGLIFYIVALGAILIGHKNNSRPFWELPLAFAAPYVLYALLFFSFHWEAKELWRFTGAFQFISIAGGFFLGIILSPLIAVVVKAVTGKEALEMTGVGLRFVNSMGLKAFGVVLGAGVIIALIYFTNVIIVEIREIGVVKKIIFYLLLFNSLFLFTFYTYSMTIFGSALKR